MLWLPSSPKEGLFVSTCVVPLLKQPAACSLPQPALLLLLMDWIYSPAQKEHGHHNEMPDMHLLIDFDLDFDWLCAAGFLSLDVDGRVIRLDTLAKLLGPGYRLGGAVDLPSTP